MGIALNMLSKFFEGVVVSITNMFIYLLYVQ